MLEVIIIKFRFRSLQGCWHGSFRSLSLLLRLSSEWHSLLLPFELLLLFLVDGFLLLFLELFGELPLTVLLVGLEVRLRLLCWLFRPFPTLFLFSPGDLLLVLPQSELIVSHLAGVFRKRAWL